MIKKAYTLIELLVVIAIIGMITSLSMVAFFSARDKARDVSRKNDLAQISRLFSQNCYSPDAGPGAYDLAIIITEFKNKNSQYAAQIPNIKDPKSGTNDQANYLYVFSDNHCAVSANLENQNEKITLPVATTTPGGGNGIFSGVKGVNGTNIYLQISN